MTDGMTAERARLRKISHGKGCGAGVSSVLERLADGRHITSHDVFYVTRTSDGARDFYARLRAAGLDIPAGDVNIPYGADPARNPDVYPATVVSLVLVRSELQAAARNLVTELDRAAERIAAADKAYGKALGF